MKQYLLILPLFLCFESQIYSQQNKIKTTRKTSINCDCTKSFLTAMISHSTNFSNEIILPVIISKDRYRMKISSKSLHQYLTILAAKNEQETDFDKNLMDSSEYLKKVLRIIHGKETLIFNTGIFEIFIKGGEYMIFDKINPYKIEIQKFGLDKFIKKRFRSEAVVWDKNVLYQLKLSEEYNKINSFNLSYLIEALFDYNMKFEMGDGVIWFNRFICD